MTPAQQMFAIAPARGAPQLSAAQIALLPGKARWIYRAAASGFPTCPTICLTRAAWAALQSERGEGSRLRSHWVATLFRLVTPGEEPPSLVVRTAAPFHIAGLAAARRDIPAPETEAESVDTSRPLARAIDQAFASYGEDEPVWAEEAEAPARDSQVIIIQAFAEGRLTQFLSRDAQSGALGPAPLPGIGGGALPPLGARASELCRLVDQETGAHMACLVSGSGDTLTFLSARPVQVGATALLEAARDRVERGIWTPREAVAGIDANQLQQLLHPRLSERASEGPIATGLGVSPGAASGEIVFTAEDAARNRARGRHCILVVMETGPADIEGMKAATGILTARGGMTSHAAVVARITGKPCVAGVRNLVIDPDDMSCRIGDRDFRAGDKITIEGTEGQVFSGALPLSRPQIGGAISKLLDWADGSRTVAVRTNVETVEAARTALSFGAEGIGLARSEHMFFSADRMVALRRMILSESPEDRRAALSGLVDYQADDYAALFAVMPGRPITVRLFDPPLHEFLPRSADDIEEIAQSLSLTPRALKARLERLEEINPMLGHRGCRLAISYPEVLDMQVRAMIAGMRAARKMIDAPLLLEIMVPFVSSAREVTWVRAKVMELIDRSGIAAEPGMAISFGTMIELPRAALRAAEIARHVDFFSFGTNDLTQTTYGISRDDAPAFLASYRRKAIFDHDPFVTIDRAGVGELIALAISRGKSANPNLKIGICGEHAGDAESLKFFASLAIDYVSCSPYRVPVARLVLAQSAGG